MHCSSSDKPKHIFDFLAEVQSLTPLITCILQRLGPDLDRDHLPQILVSNVNPVPPLPRKKKSLKMQTKAASKSLTEQLVLRVLQYEDEDRDKVVLASDDDLTAAVDHARLAGWKACTN